MSRKQPVMSHDPLAALSPTGDETTEAPAEPVRRRTRAPSKKVAKRSGQKIQLPASLTIGDVAEVHASLLNRMLEIKSLEIDASQVEVIDAAGIQLLMAARRSATEKGVAMALLNPSDVLNRAAMQIGLDTALEIDHS